MCLYFSYKFVKLDTCPIKQGYDDIPKEIQDADAKKVTYYDYSVSQIGTDYVLYQILTV